MMSRRAVPAVRKVLGLRLRALRQARSFSQEQLGRRAGLSGKFIGEVERAQKSISVDSLNDVAGALGVPLTAFLILPRRDSPELERIFALALIAGPAQARRARAMLQALLR
jgi:transcriptional regulator with XRE-family HTH domain